MAWPQVLKLQTAQKKKKSLLTKVPETTKNITGCYTPKITTAKEHNPD